MKETYLKSGSTLRLERSASSTTLVRVDEGGSSETEHDRFVARSLDPGSSHALSETALLRLEQQIDAATAGVEVERMTLVAGAATHTLRTEGEPRHWNEQSVRVHVSLIVPDSGLRTTVDLGARDAAILRTEPLEAITAALRGYRPTHPPDSEVNIALRSNVAAAIWPSLLLHASLPELDKDTRNPAFSLRQDRHAAIRFDGRGMEIEPRDWIHQGRIVSALGLTSRNWPNVFRPSFRLPPRPMPFHLRAHGEPSAVRADIESVGMIGPVRSEGRALRCELLCLGDRGTFAAVLSMPLERWFQSIATIDDDQVWYPYAAGSFGGRTVLSGVCLRPWP